MLLFFCAPSSLSFSFSSKRELFLGAYLPSKSGDFNTRFLGNFQATHSSRAHPARCTLSLDFLIPLFSLSLSPALRFSLEAPPSWSRLFLRALSLSLPLLLQRYLKQFLISLNSLQRHSEQPRNAPPRENGWHFSSAGISPPLQRVWNVECAARVYAGEGEREGCGLGARDIKNFECAFFAASLLLGTTLI